ncbi:MAG: hypothetical protein AAF127_05105 [Pseudomonadota bacterium]
MKNSLQISGLALFSILLSPALHAKEDIPSRLTHFTEISEIGEEGTKVPLNTYTRLEVISGEAGQSIGYAKRPLLFRISIGKKYLTNILLHAESGRFTAATPLVSREYVSSSERGESFVREVSYDAYDFPLFLVGSQNGGVASFSITIDTDETSDTSITAISLGAVTKALNTVAPGSGVVTALTADSTAQVASEIDQAAGKASSTSVREKSDFDVKLSEGAQLLLRVRGPELETNELNADKVLGEWTIRFSQAQPSIFSDVKCAENIGERCAAVDGSSIEPALAAYQQAISDPGTVLSYELIDKIGNVGTISAFLSQQEWWADGLSALASSDPGYGQFCRSIRKAVGSIGLNDLDGRIIATSFANSGVVDDDAMTGLLESSDCKYQ